MSTEIWKDVVGYEGIYEVSNIGKIKSYINMYPRILKQKVHTNKTCRVSLWKDGKEKTWLVHRVVALAFIPLVEGKDYINHIGGSRLDNTVENLEWCNHEENNNHAFDNRLIDTGKITVLRNIESKQEHRFRSMAKASEFFNRSHGYISNCLKQGKTEIGGYKIMLQE